MREARAAGVGESRLLFAARMPREESLACLKHADLFLDTLRFNTNRGLTDALRLGVTGSRDAYVAEAIRLGHHPGELAKRRQQVQSARSSAPLFDLQGRLRDWEAAWMVMAERSRAGLPPAAFGVPLAG